jgi:hypothetical protein
MGCGEKVASNDLHGLGCEVRRRNVIALSLCPANETPPPQSPTTWCLPPSPTRAQRVISSLTTHKTSIPISPSQYSRELLRTSAHHPALQLSRAVNTGLTTLQTHIYPLHITRTTSTMTTRSPQMHSPTSHPERPRGTHVVLEGVNVAKICRYPKEFKLLSVELADLTYQRDCATH